MEPPSSQTTDRSTMNYQDTTTQDQVVDRCCSCCYDCFQGFIDFLCCDSDSF
ncbi:hypothetical protein RND81_13G200900 [Saponaria officinalis]|uniref:Uncharacterized protein n=1 Tax=Saponaria officinalis TaxID=3572 RepID=A0AAW1H5H5_SAPOF